MGKVTRSKSVPKNMQARYDQIVALTDEFCHRHLPTKPTSPSILPLLL
jgi:hypothetical protein